MKDRRPTIDFIVESPDRKTQLVVEAKNTTAASPEWASRFLRNLFVHASIPKSEYFLLALRNRFFLWHHPDPMQPRNPDFEGDAEQALAPYLSKIHDRVSMMSESGFELLVHAWLADLVTGTLPTVPDWLEESGLRDAIRDGVVKSQLAA